MIVSVLFLSLSATFASGRRDGNEKAFLSGTEADGERSFTLITLDPGRRKAFPGAGNSADELLAAQLFAGLLDFDAATGRCLPALASDWQFSSDRMSCRLTLGESFWSDGTQVRAAQLRDSWLRVLLSGTPASLYMASLIKGGRDYIGQYAGQGERREEDLPESLPGIRILDDHKMILEFEKPCRPESLAAPAFYLYPPEVFDRGDHLYGIPENLNSSGAYEIADLKEGTITLRLREGLSSSFRSGGPEILRILVPENREKALELFFDYRDNRNSRADWLAPDAFPLHRIEELEGRADYFEPAGFSSYFYILNRERSLPDRGEPRSFLPGNIDRDKLLKDLHRAARLPAFSILPPSLFPGYDYKQLSGEGIDFHETASLPGLSGETLTLICPSDTGHLQTARALIRQWREKQGISVELKAMESRDFLQARERGEYDLAVGGWLFMSPDPSELLIQFLPGGVYGKSGGDLFEQALVRALKAGGDYDLVKEAEDVLFRKDFHLLPLFHSSRPQLLGGIWQGNPDFTSWFPPSLQRLYEK